MRDVKSCGFLVLRRSPVFSFLLMKHPSRWDLPKGHVDPGETELQCAYRELAEETGIQEVDLEQEKSFRFTLEYLVKDRKDPRRMAHKTLVIFLGWLRRDVAIKVTEHESYRWFEWDPPHQIQVTAIDPILAFAEQFLEEREVGRE